MRLIDADELKKDIQYCKKVNNSEDVPISKEFDAGMNQAFDLMLKRLEKQPIAYDVDEKVDKLKELHINYRFRYEISNDLYDHGAAAAFDLAIQIVKTGGRDE